MNSPAVSVAAPAVADTVSSLKPRWIQGLAILLWGVTTGLILFAIPMAVVLEARYFTRRRFNLQQQDFYQIANLTTLGLGGLIAFLIWGPRNTHFIIALTELLPIVFFPLVTVIAYSTMERMPLDVLFYSLRKQQAPVTQSWDMDYIFIAACVVGAGTAQGAGLYYLPAAAFVVAASLFRLRSPRYNTATWLLPVAVAILASIYAAQFFRATHLEIKTRSTAWFLDYWRGRTDPFRSRTAMGAVGKLKLSDEIVFRIKPIGSSAVPQLLQEATYDTFSEDSWQTLPGTLTTVPAVDEFVWEVNTPGVDDEAATVYLEFRRDRSLVPVPEGVTMLRDLPAATIKRSPFGTIEAHGLVPTPGYRMDFASHKREPNLAPSINSPPARYDALPEGHADLIDEIIDANVGDDRPASASQSVAWVRRFFSDFRYTLYQPVLDNIDPVAHFLTVARAGHCEYFATATVLMLRQLGVPARYVVGYSAQEYSPMLDMIVVRKRHAHAWAIAWVDDRWQVVDTTPDVWLKTEEASMGFLRPLADLVDHLLFRYRIWWDKQKIEDYQAELIIGGVILGLYLVYRLARSEQVMVGGGEATPGDQPRQPGLDSPFYRIVDFLDAAGFTRGHGESLSAWLDRTGHSELKPILSLHYAIRFDPDAGGAELSRALSAEVDRWIDRAPHHLNVSNNPDDLSSAIG